MGKVVGLIGSASGKIGNVVYAVTNGIQTARVYNPKVANPKSASQTTQRLKMALAGRMSKLTSPSMLEGIDAPNRRMRNAGFIANIAKNATVSVVDGVKRANIAVADIRFSDGSLNVMSVSNTITAVYTNSTSLTVTLNETTLSVYAPAGYKEKVIMGCYNVATSQFDYFLESERLNGARIQNTFRITDNVNEHLVAVWIIPMAVDTDRVKMSTSYLGAGSSSVYVNDIVTEKETMYYGESVLAASQTVAPYTPGT